MLVYMALQVVVEYRIYVAAYTRGLLPHIFTLAICKITAYIMQYGICSRRLFSVTPSMSFHPSALSAVQCPFLSGLSSRYESGDRTTRQGGKGRYFINSHKTFIYASFILILCRNKSKETFECGNPLFATLKIECAAVRPQIVCFNNFCRSFNFFTEYLYFISQ